MTRRIRTLLILAVALGFTTAGCRPECEDCDECGECDDDDTCGGEWVGAPWESVTAGAFHACALRTDHTLDCWGLNHAGQTEEPGVPLVQVDAGEEHTCGITEDGEVLCWGCDGFIEDVGQCDPPSGTFVQVEAAYALSCGIRTDGTVSCWGEDAGGQVGDVPAGAFVSVSSFYGSVCAVREDGSAECWGYNTFGQNDLPAGPFKQVEAVDWETFVLYPDGTFDCFGYMNCETFDVQFEQISGYGTNLCGLHADGSIECLTYNVGGRADVPGGAYTHVAAGYNFTCGLTTDAELRCWGCGVSEPGDPSNHDHWCDDFGQCDTPE
jgi:alpha-tubulin suppressor-like RCC1 family protein